MTNNKVKISRFYTLLASIIPSLPCPIRETYLKNQGLTYFLVPNCCSSFCIIIIIIIIVSFTGSEE